MEQDRRDTDIRTLTDRFENLERNMVTSETFSNDFNDLWEQLRTNCDELAVRIHKAALGLG